jgi:hypothetical protein
MAWHQRAIVIGLATVGGLLAAVKARLASARRTEHGESAKPEMLPAPAATAGRRSLTREQLYQQARRLDIAGRSRMTKAELQAAIAQRTKGAA